MHTKSFLAVIVAALALVLGSSSESVITTQDELAPLEAEPMQRGDTCGDGRCQPPDDCNSCPQDCGECNRCGDYRCQPPEDCNSCPQDCRC